jgi:hypothetical protein
MMDPSERDVLNPINNVDYLEKLIEKGYVLEGPRQDASKNLIVFKSFLRKKHNFIPEDLLKSRGYKFVEPSNFTKGFKLAYKLNEDVLEQYFKSNYSLHKKNRNIYLYLIEKR